MTRTFALTLILALGAPAAAEPAAPELPLIDAAVVRAQPFEKENINIGAAFPGMQVCKFTGVQGDTCSFACKDGSVVKRPRLNSAIAQNGGCPTMVMVPAAGEKGRSSAQTYAQGALFAYNRDTRQFDIRTGRACSVTLKNFKSYNDTEHGTPRDVVSAEYVLGGFSDLGSYTAGTAVGSAPEALAPYVSLQNYLPSGLSKGIDVKIFVDNVPSAQALLSRPAPPTSVYVTKENTMSSYFGGDGVKWGYWCDLRGAQ